MPYKLCKNRVGETIYDGKVTTYNKDKKVSGIGDIWFCMTLEECLKWCNILDYYYYFECEVGEFKEDGNREGKYITRSLKRIGEVKIFEEGIRNNLEAFGYGCYDGDLEMLKWIKDNIDLSIKDILFNDNQFFGLAFQRGHLHIIQWIKDNFPRFNINDIRSFDNYSFRIACRYGHLEMIQWIKDNYPEFNINDVRSYNNYAFRLACRYGHLEIIKWIKDNYPEFNINDVKSCNNYAFIHSSENGHLEIVQWIKDNYPESL
jgi:sulfur relay (sulfurtransferase) DsrC/TusE family protein